MSDMLKTGSEFQRDILKEYAASPIEFFNSDGSVKLRATITESEWENPDEPSLVIIQTQDFIVDPEDLVIDSSEVKPVSGNYIMFNGEKYSVVKGPHKEYWKYSDGYRNRIRIYTMTDGA